MVVVRRGGATRASVYRTVVRVKGPPQVADCTTGKAFTKGLCGKPQRGIPIRDDYTLMLFLEGREY